MRCFSKSGGNTISTGRGQEFFRNIMKAKVDQLNLVLVILKLVLAAGKLYMWVCVCVCVSSASFNSVCLYSLLLAVGSMFGFCGVWCWHLGKASLGGHCPVEWPSSLGAWGVRWWVASRPSWRNLTFTMDCICWAKKADSFIEQNEPIGARSSTS